MFLRMMGVQTSTNEYWQQPIQSLKGVGVKRAQAYRRLNIHTIGDLLRHYPRGYRNYEVVDSLAGCALDEMISVNVVVDRMIRPVRTKGGRTIARIYASTTADEPMELVFFNNPYVLQNLSVGDEVIFYGKLQGDLLQHRMVNPVQVKREELEGLVPQYPLTDGLTSRMVVTNVHAAMDDTRYYCEEILPEAILDRYQLVSREEALRAIHFPKSWDEVQLARKRLVFEELFLLSIGMKLRKQQRVTQTQHAFHDVDYTPFLNQLPFQMTGAQQRSLDEIVADLQKIVPMNRLLQGDVGSGKTAVAAAAAYLAVQNNRQCAIMAPTEVLATQHAETFQRFLEPFGIQVGLLTSSVKGKARKTLLEQIQSGGCQVVVGTHALIGPEVDYANLGLVSTDEQHRFGVRQRGALAQKGTQPHTLVMSATPIPRTLSLIVYGDLDISILDELPAGRRPIKTRLVDDSYRSRYLGFVRETVERGEQAYIVCPLVEDSEVMSDMISATEYFEQLQSQWLTDIPTGLIHGKMNPKDKQEVMARFHSGEYKVLVSTTVIEVGVDCPNATLMIIENAERFGLSTLHQLRGRVGRGGLQSWCILVSSSKTANAKERLNLLTRSNDGFEIAREDLRMRGPGDFLGSRQHGLPELAVADLANDEQVLYTAAEAAGNLLAEDPQLVHYPVLLNAVSALFERAVDTMN